MQKRSHAQLAAALLHRGESLPARRYQWAFLIGSVEPDCNPLSYLKGSLRHKKFGGHTYANSRDYIDKRIRRLQSRERWNVWHYYTLGKLTHYVADAFTYPHNPHFPEHGWAHHVYETRLRGRLTEYLAGMDWDDNPDGVQECHMNGVCDGVLWPDGVESISPDVGEEIARLHRDYLAAESSPDRDIAYILRANALLMAGCHAPERERIPMKPDRPAWKRWIPPCPGFSRG